MGILTTVLLSAALSFTPNVESSVDYDGSTELKKEKTLQQLAKELHREMGERKISMLLFETYGRGHTGFFVIRNTDDDKGQYLRFNAEDQKEATYAQIKTMDEFRGIDSVKVKKNDEDAVRVSEKNMDAKTLYDIMIRMSYKHIGATQSDADGKYWHINKSDTEIVDGIFTTALDNIIATAQGSVGNTSYMSICAGNSATEIQLITDLKHLREEVFTSSFSSYTCPSNLLLGVL